MGHDHREFPTLAEALLAIVLVIAGVGGCLLAATAMYALDRWVW